MKTVAITDEQHKKLCYLKLRWNKASIREVLEDMIEFYASGIKELS